MSEQKNEDGMVDAIASVLLITIALVGAVFWLSGMPS